ncbi:hypothetical protein ACFU8W_21325, partial [Streptomyces sp. NPDC057565]|uniref:hypothetical protein n=1 Tax=Streptomyces sp. NPDC057565 TaxID=3346169 RepID=UPI00367B897C
MGSPGWGPANLVVADCAVPCRREWIMLVVTSGIERPRWWFALRSGAFFLVGGGLAVFTYGMFSHRTAGALPSLFFGGNPRLQDSAEECVIRAGLGRCSSVTVVVMGGRAER